MNDFYLCKVEIGYFLRNQLGCDSCKRNILNIQVEDNQKWIIPTIIDNNCSDYVQNNILHMNMIETLT